LLVVIERPQQRGLFWETVINDGAVIAVRLREALSRPLLVFLQI
jgi:hypothetical protein